ncbi:MAG: glutaredoxin domain-containing protein [Candidatus Woesearchaeota archaeon]
MSKVKVYTTPTCPYCYMLKDYLRANKIDYEDVDVSNDYEAAMEMIQKSGQRGVPVADIDGNIVVGFDQQRIARLLNLKR